MSLVTWRGDILDTPAAGYSGPACYAGLAAGDHDGRPFFSAMTIVWSAGGTSHWQTFQWSRRTGTSALPFWH